MSHIYTFTTKRFLRAVENSLTSGKNLYLLQKSKIPWMEIGSYAALTVVLILIGQSSLLVLELVPIVLLIGVIHITLSLIKCFKNRRRLKKTVTPLTYLQKELKPYFKIKIKPNYTDLVILLFKEDLTFESWEIKSEDVTFLELSEDSYFEIHTTDHVIIIPRSLFIFRDYQNLLEPYQQMLEDIEDSINADKVHDMNNHIPVLTRISSVPV